MPNVREFRLPDIGEFENIDVVEVLVSPGDRVAQEDSLIVLESDKATMEVPSPWSAVVKEIRVAVGDQVSEGDLIALLEVDEEQASAAPAAPQSPPEEPVATSPPEEPVATSPPEESAAAPTKQPTSPPGTLGAPGARAHASPSVRRLARELGVDLGLVPGSATKGRITKEDVQGFVQASLAKGSAAGVPIAGVRVAAPQEIDFSKFGPTELEPLNRIRKLSSANLQRSWVTVPHVTQFDEADITDLDAFRKSQKSAADAHGAKLTFLPFIIKACTAALGEFPHFNSSLDHTGENLILKRYFHVGVAVETEHGLIVPVVKDADRKGLFELALELQDLSDRARRRRLSPGDLQGGTFSISSLGGIGGTFFTPIVNHPEVAILGVSKMEWRPVWRDGEFVPRLTLPLSLSYDHRVIDGADAVRFTQRIAAFLSDLRLLLV